MRPVLIVLFVYSFFILNALAIAQEKIPLEGFVKARDGVRIYYHIEGSGSETVVVSGGFLNEEGLKPLAQTRLVIFYDARGRGRSDSVKGTQVGLDHQVNDLEKQEHGKMILKVIAGPKQVSCSRPLFLIVPNRKIIRMCVSIQMNDLLI